MNTSERPALTVRDAAFCLLRALGMTTIFGNMGSTEIAMFRDFPADFRYVTGLQESVAVAMADGYAQATANAVVVSLHSAAGVGHAMGSLLTAWKNRTPLVVVAGQQARALLAGEPYLLNDQPTELPRPYVKWSREPARPQDLPESIARAYYLAMSPPRGPTLVSAPADDWDARASAVQPRQVVTALAPPAGSLDRIGHALAAARVPAFVVGAEVDRHGAFHDVVNLAELHQARVWEAPMSHRCSFPETHRLFAGFLPAVPAELAARLASHDVVLVIGAPAFTYHVAGAPSLPATTEFFQLTEDPQAAAWAPTAVSVITGIGPAVRALLSFPPAAERAAPSLRQVPARITPGEAISQAFLMQTLADLRPENSVIVEEAPTSRPVMCEYLPNVRPESFYTCASGALGFSLPAAVGMALGRPGERIIAVLGDGAAMYSVQALWTAASLRVPLTILIVNNRRYATVENFGRRIGIDNAVGTAIGGLDFVLLARAQGCAAARVSDPAALSTAITEALSARGPYLVEIVVAD